MLILSRKAIGSRRRCKELCIENAQSFVVLEVNGQQIEVSLISSGNHVKVGVEAPQNVRVFRGEFYLLRKAAVAETADATGMPEHICAMAFDDAYKSIKEEDAALRAQYARAEAIEILRAA